MYESFNVLLLFYDAQMITRTDFDCGAEIKTKMDAMLKIQTLLFFFNKL